MEELGDLARRAARRRRPRSAAGRRAAPSPSSRRAGRRGGAAARATRGSGSPAWRRRLDPRPDAERPVERARASRPCASSKPRDDRGVDLLVDARHAREDRRPHRRSAVGDAERVGAEGEREARRTAPTGGGAARSCGRAGGRGAACRRARRSRSHLVDDGDHLVVVAVADHAALRRAGRARRVDVREEVVLADRGARLVERRRVRRGELAAARLEVVEVGEREHVAEPGQLGPRPPRPSRAAPRPRRGRRPPPSGRARTRSPAASCSRRSGRRSRRRGRARSRTAPTRGASRRGSRTRRPSRTPSASRPFASSSTRRAASAHETSSQPPSRSARYAGPAAARATAFRQSARDRALGCAASPRAMSGGDTSVKGRRGPRLEFECPMRTTWNGSISFGLVTIPVGLAPATKPAARQSDVSFRHAPPRVQDADQAEALVPGARARGRAGRDRQGLGGREGRVRDRRGRRPRGDRARSTSRAIEITRFVPLDEVDPIYFDRTYFLVPGERAGRAGGRTCCC